VRPPDPICLCTWKFARCLDSGGGCEKICHVQGQLLFVFGFTGSTF
jgi:hypothetical protein